MNKKKIKYLILDLDGVITDGTVTISSSNDEYKSYSYQDLDAITSMQKIGLEIAIVTAEKSPIVTIIAKRFKINNVIKGAKDKLKAISKLKHSNSISFNEICYIADGDRDALALEKVGFGFCPINGTKLAKEASNKILNSSGGNGAIAEAVEFLVENELI